MFKIYSQNLSGTLPCVSHLFSLFPHFYFSKHLLIALSFQTWFSADFDFLVPFPGDHSTPHPPVLGFSEIACSSLFSLPTLRFSIPELSIMVATSHNLHRDVIASKESTDFILKARAGIAGIADTWSRRLRLTILGIRRGTRRSKWPRFNLLVAVTRLYMIICGPVYG